MGEDTCIGTKSIETTARRTNPQCAGIVLDDGCYPVVAQAGRIKVVVLKVSYLSGIRVEAIEPFAVCSEPQST